MACSCRLRPMGRRAKTVAWVALALLGDAPHSGTLACSMIAVGSEASASGAAMLGHSEDSGPMTNDVRLVHVPRKTWPAGAMRPLYQVQAGYPRIVDPDRAPDYAPLEGQEVPEPLGYIPQVRETYAYYDTDYGVQNEKGLAIGESTCTANTVGWPSSLPYGYNKAGIAELSKIALERCSTARCAVKTMGRIAEELGFYSEDSGDPLDPGYSGSSECLGLTDRTGHIWLFNILTGKNNASAIWAAQRFPKNHIVVAANAFTIRKMNLSDSANFLFSPGVSKLAEEMGWWRPEEEAHPGVFDFFKSYGYTPPHTALGQQMANIFAYYSGRRMWRAFSLLSPAEGAKLDPDKGNLPLTKDPYPASVPAPRGSVTLKMVLDTYRDHYEGTKYDLTKGMAAGPFGNPNRGPLKPAVPGMWERAISMYRTTWSFVNEVKPDSKNILWFSYDAPHGSVYLPFYGAAAGPPPQSYRSHAGTMARFSREVAWWAFNLINQYEELNFQLINPDVQSHAHRIEQEAFERVAQWEAEATSANGSGVDLSLLSRRSNAFAEEKVAEWWGFSEQLFAKYGRYVVTYNESATGEASDSSAGLGKQADTSMTSDAPPVAPTATSPSLSKSLLRLSDLVNDSDGVAECALEPAESTPDATPSTPSPLHSGRRLHGPSWAAGLQPCLMPAAGPAGFQSCLMQAAGQPGVPVPVPVPVPCQDHLQVNLCLAAAIPQMVGDAAAGQSPVSQQEEARGSAGPDELVVASLPAPLTGEGARDSRKVTATLRLEGRLSRSVPTVGSVGHKAGTCKPCAFAWRTSGCRNGEECIFCHLCLPGEKRYRSKKEARKESSSGNF